MSYIVSMIALRNAQPSDVNALSDLASLCFIDTFGQLYSKEDLSTHLHTTCSETFFSDAMLHDSLLVAEENDTLIGYIKFGEVGLPINPLQNGSKEIHRLYVHPAFKGKGIGRNLMKLAFDNPTLKASKHLYLGVYEDNKHAQKFYQSYGFSIIGTYDYYVGSQIDREYIMHKKTPNRK